jgi:hypothetical protein
MKGFWIGEKVIGDWENSEVKILPCPQESSHSPLLQPSKYLTT